MSASRSQANILAFAESLTKRRPMRRNPSQKPVIKKSDLYVPNERTHDLIPLKKALEVGLLRGSLAVLNRKASAGDMKAIKVPGDKSWQVLPEWIEEFNNGWARNYNEKNRA